MHAEVCRQNHVVNCIVMHLPIVICVVVFHFPLNISWKCRDHRVPVQLCAYCGHCTAIQRGAIFLPIFLKIFNFLKLAKTPLRKVNHEPREHIEGFQKIQNPLMLRQQQCTPPNTDLESCWMSSFCGNYLRFLSLDLFWQSIFSCLFYGKISGEKLLLLTKTELYVYEMRTTSKNACFYWQSHNTKKMKKILVGFYLNFLFCFLWYFLPQWLGTFLS